MPSGCKERPRTAVNRIQFSVPDAIKTIGTQERKKEKKCFAGSQSERHTNRRSAAHSGSRIVTKFHSRIQSIARTSTTHLLPKASLCHQSRIAKSLLQSETTREENGHVFRAMKGRSNHGVSRASGEGSQAMITTSNCQKSPSRPSAAINQGRYAPDKTIKPCANHKQPQHTHKTTTNPRLLRSRRMTDALEDDGISEYERDEWFTAALLIARGKTTPQDRKTIT